MSSLRYCSVMFYRYALSSWTRDHLQKDTAALDAKLGQAAAAADPRLPAVITHLIEEYAGFGPKLVDTILCGSHRVTAAVNGVEASLGCEGLWVGNTRGCQEVHERCAHAQETVAVTLLFNGLHSEDRIDAVYLWDFVVNGPGAVSDRYEDVFTDMYNEIFMSAYRDDDQPSDDEDGGLPADDGVIKASAAALAEALRQAIILAATLATG